MPSTRSAVLLAILGASLAACQSSAPPPVAAVAAAPAPVIADLAPGAGCGPTIARTQSIVAGDVQTGDLSEPVGQRFGADLAKAADACAAGRDAEALRLHAAAKARYGYR
ncbi:hypothetical protein [Methylorubrum salsuginis]|uniref:Lipoprotein n=1 Tax=Methylorubrum salsuginis TaxID=414703 RepID=A0A1I4II56_9HYPH|nr:hypothetical protein [Methylorubrum salsuginis]SFL53456.1 hypothetical protein SAMN04488125_11765 [Methylorubrum salsuginis]